MLQFFRNILGAPFALIWAFLMRCRRAFFNRNGGINRKSYNLPLINVGNLSTGGTGKTPHVEYLIRLIESICPINCMAILSRGYGRKSKDFLFADHYSNSISIGDEPMQYHKKFPYLPIAVDKNRINGIEKILKTLPETKVILMDDAYQYLKIKAGLNIILTKYVKIYKDDNVVPMGNLRESSIAAKEADAVIVTKCPPVLSQLHERTIIKKLNLKPNQKVFFSYMQFLPLHEFTPAAKRQNYELKSVVLLTAIANPQPLISYLKSQYKEFQMLIFRDHHQFTMKDILKAKNYLKRSLSPCCAIIVTEKDATRLCMDEFRDVLSNLPIYILPVKVEFHKKYKEPFEQFILNYVKSHSRNQ